MAGDDERNDSDPERAAILARRKQFIALALSGLTTTAAACTDKPGKASDDQTAPRIKAEPHAVEQPSPQQQGEDEPSPPEDSPPVPEHNPLPEKPSPLPEGSSPLPEDPPSLPEAPPSLPEAPPPLPEAPPPLPDAPPPLPESDQPQLPPNVIRPDRELYNESRPRKPAGE